MTAKCPGYLNNINSIPLDVSNEYVYQVLDSIIGEAAQYWKDEYIHLGGDEVVGACWGADPNIAQWMRRMGFSDSNQVVQYFEDKVQEIARKYGKKVINWQEIFFNGIKVRDSTVIEVWLDQNTLMEVANCNRDTMLSYGWFVFQ